MALLIDNLHLFMNPFENKLSVVLFSTTDTTRQEMVKET